MKKLMKKSTIRRIVSIVLTAAILFTSLGLENFTNIVKAAASYTTLYLVDDTPEHWLGNDNAVIEMVDNTFGHDRYIMTKESGNRWSVRVPSTTYNVTFNRLSPDKSTQWNSWSAGGRDTHSTYHAITHEHGYWEGTAVLEEGFREGDIIYLDYYEFNDWKLSNAQFYVNFTAASKQENNGQDININYGDKEKYSPIKLVHEIEEDVFTYTVTKEDEGAKELRFWRGNTDTLWNCSVTLSYSDYKAGNNCAKIQGWNDTGYVCPYVPRRHITRIDSIELNVSGNRKVNRKITIDLDIQGETELLLQDETTITIEKVNGNTGSVFYDDSETLWNHRELIFKEAGNYHITAVATDGTDTFSTEKYITIAEDQAPAADFKRNSDDNIYLRDSRGTAHISVTDMSVSEPGDDITKRIYKLYHDVNGNGVFEEEELIGQTVGNETEVNYTLSSVGKYMVNLYVQEAFTDTIPQFLHDNDYLSGEISKTFEIVNQAPESSMSLEKSKIADIIFTVGNADRDLLDKYVSAGEKVKDKLKELGIEAKVSTVSSSALTAQDTFAWKEYDHYDYKDSYGQQLPKHILYDGKDIKMLGYFRAPLKDFLYIDDNDSSRKVFEFDLQRDGTDWHSMEGGGFLFNTVVSEEENYIQGYCILVTQSGLKLVQMNKTDLSKFRNGSYSTVQKTGRLLQTFKITDLYAEHHFKIIVDKNVLTVYDGDKLIINEYVLPEDEIDAYGYGPIISHGSHNCGQQSFFTFKNIVMQTITGESLSDVVNNHIWTPGTNHYVINLSETSVPELSDNDRLADVASAMLQNDAMFFGIGNDNTIDQYNTLQNTLEGKGETIELRYEEEDDREEENYKVSVEEGVDRIVSAVIADINSKDYSIGYTLATDEEVIYTETYHDPDNDPVGMEEWNYMYDGSVFGENNTSIQEIKRETPITMFTEAGAYEISHRVSDDPTGGNPDLTSYIKWSDTDEYKKLILAQHRPTAKVTATVTQSPSDRNKCMVNVIYESEDIDHPSDSRKGIREEKFYYKKLGDTEWTEGRFPAEAEMGTTYLVKYIVTDIEGTVSRPAMAAIKTSEARVFTEPEDTNPPVIDLTVSSDTVEVGETFYIETSASDDYGITDFSVYVNGDKSGNTYGRYEITTEIAGEIRITVTATDIGKNTSTETRTVTVLDKSDVTPPNIDILSPGSGAISGKTDIIGSITDNKQLKSYTVTRTYIKTGTAENESETADTELLEPVVIAEGTEEIINDVIAVINTEELVNGVYKIEIMAEDTAGLRSTATLLITVEETVSDRIPPQAEISDILLTEDNKEITVIGSVTDETELERYELIMYPSGHEADKTTIAVGTEAVINERIGSITTENLESGTYILELKAWDTEGNTCVSGASFTYTKGSSETEEKGEIGREEDTVPPVIAGELRAAITDSGLQLVLSGTIYDENLKEYTVLTGRKYEDTLRSPITIAHGYENISEKTIAEYTYGDFSEGNYAVRIIAEDHAGNKRTADYMVTVTKQGMIDDGYQGETGGSTGDTGDKELNLVLSGFTANVGDTVKAYMTYPKTASDVTLTAGGADVTIFGRNADIKADSAGEVEVILSAVIDGETKTVSRTVRFFDKSDKIHPTAYFLTPEADSTVRTKTEITGTAADETGMAYYILEYRMEGTDEYRQIAYKTEPVTEGVLGELDTTMLENGRYVLRLTVVDNGGNRICVERSINVEGNLKIGNMNLSFTDISANVSGIPLTVTRSYDSRNKSSGDFGVGWKLGMQSVKLTESTDITQGYQMIQQGNMLSTGYYMTQTACHDITVTYGDGTSDRFELKLSPERQGLVPIYEVAVSFLCVTDKNVKLELNGDNHALVYGDQLLLEDDGLFENRSYILTKKDGTKLYLDGSHGLLKMTDTNGNTISVSKNGLKHSDGNGVTFTRDRQGRIIKAEERGSAGNIITSMSYAYDNKDNLIAVTDGTGRTVTFTYDDDHNLIDIIDPSGMAVARNEYDENGRLVAVIDAEGNRVEYDHDLEGKTETVRDKMGNVTVYTYDDNGNILQTVDALGNVTSSTYDKNNNVLTKTDARGNVTTYNYDESNNILEIINKEGVITGASYQDNMLMSITKDNIIYSQFEYDNKGNITSVTDGEENTTDFSYDNKGNMTSVTDSIGELISYTYDINGNISESKNGNGDITFYTRDDSGKCTEMSVVRTTENGVENISVYYSYDDVGNVISKTDANGNITHYNYDITGNLSSAIDAEGRETKYEYDSDGKLVKITYFDNTTETFTYDVNGNNLSVTNTKGQTIYMAYDKLGRMVSKTYENGGTEKYVYDANGNVVQKQSVNGAITVYEYDSMNRNIAITDVYGNRTEYEYDMDSNITKMTDANKNVFSYEYNNKGNCTKIILPNNSVISSVYDVRGRLIEKTDAMGIKTRYEYDGVGRLIKLIDALGNETCYEYDEVGNLKLVEDALGNEMSYEYDNMSRIIKETNALGDKKLYKYDMRGELTKFTDFSGTVTEYKYDEKGRLIEKNVDGDKIFYRYEKNIDQLTSVVSADGIVYYEYDEFGKICSRTDINGITIGYEYTLSGQISSITTPYGNTKFQYDLLERLVRVVDHNGNVTVYSYDAIGNRTAVTYANGIKLQYKYDFCSYLIQEDIIDKNNNIIKRFVYKRDKNGYPVSCNEIFGDMTITTEYEYDISGRLAKEVIQDDIGKIINSYEYDSVGNRLSKNTVIIGDITNFANSEKESINTNIIYVYNANNQLIKEKRGDIEISYVYDRNGNLVSVSNEGKTIQYEYNKQNKLIKYHSYNVDGAELVYNYQYDYEGNRIGKFTENQAINYVVDCIGELSYVLAETDGQGELIKYYTRGSELISQETNDSLYNYLYDGYGNVCILVDRSGTISDSYRFDAFGNILSKAGQTNNHYLYKGEEFDEELGFYYLRARYMNPSTGTFVQRDTYRGNVYEAVSLHRYLYANANPVVYSDPSGCFSILELQVSFNISSVISSTIRLSYNIAKYKNIIDTVVVTVSVINIATTIVELLSGEKDYFDALMTLTLSTCTIIATVATCPKIFTVFVGIVGMGSDVVGLVEAARNGEWWRVIGQIGAITIDLFSMGVLINDIHTDTLFKNFEPSVKNGDQITLINLTKEAIASGGLTEHIKDILFEWAKEYDSFEDIWNLIFHL